MVQSSCTTVPEILRNAEQSPEFGARFLERTGKESFYPYPEVVRRAKLAAQALLENGLRPGDRVVLILPTSIQFFDALLGVQLAGGIPASLYPPFRLGKLDDYLGRLRAMMSSIETRFLITDNRIRKILGSGVAGVTSLDKVIDVAELINHSGNGHWEPFDADPTGLAFLQFSSGTTIEPKAVMVSHRSLVENLEMMKRAMGSLTEEDQQHGGVCWLPLYHDMGLVGNLYQGLYYPGTVTYMGPEVFIAKPALWLQAISRYRAFISTAPNFAYGLCLTRIKDDQMKDVDLSCWRMALNGAEPIDVTTLKLFTERFKKWGLAPEAMTPVYGLAEAVLAVSFSKMEELPHIKTFDRLALSEKGLAVPGEGRELVSVGSPMPGLDVQIHDPEHTPLPEGQVGKIVIRGPSITDGYYANEKLSENTIRNGWLDTGDLGFLFEGKLYISGRAKDLIIIRGQNYAPQEIEDLLMDIDGVRLGRSVAISTLVKDQGEELILLSERDSRSTRAENEIIADIREKIIAGISLVPYHVELLKPGTIPRTSSGKLRRSEALRQFLEGDLVPPEKITALKLLKDLSKSQVSWMKFRLQRMMKKNEPIERSNLT